MKIGIIIPDRNDRPQFLKNCLRMIGRQTIKPDIVELVNDPPLNNECDITWRYRMGYERFRNKGLDAILFIENDDWYKDNYIETMINEWINHGKPELFGTDYTIYYHIKLFAYFTMNHKTRSSAMSTLIKPDMDFKWCPDSDAYTDKHLWFHLKGVVFKPKEHICLGIKHGTGFCGGRMHFDRLELYDSRGLVDYDKILLRRIMDQESYNFYSKVML